MAWTDTTPCSYCGREVSIFKRVGEFCSKAHQEAYLQQQNQLAVEVLHRTHDALKAYRPKTASIEDILGLPSASPAKVEEPAPVAVQEVEEFQEVTVEPVEYVEEVPEPRPAMGTEFFHVGDTIGKLNQGGFLASLRRLWESLTAR